MQNTSNIMAYVSDPAIRGSQHWEKSQDLADTKQQQNQSLV